MTEKLMHISYSVETTDILQVLVQAGETDGAGLEAEPRGVLKLTLKDAKTGMTLQEASTGGSLPLDCHVTFNISEASKKGASYKALAQWTPKNDGSDSPEDRQNRPQRELLPIEIEGYEGKLLPHFCYTLNAKASTGRPAVCTFQDVTFQILAAEGYELSEDPENVRLEYISRDGSSCFYSGEVFKDGHIFSFPDQCPIPSDSALPLDLTVSCEAMFQKTDHPETRRKTALKFSTT